ncbi:hypothetical protein SORBI_3002G158000 [Sorghum bicolor]|nr:hypothetical protein SORBI_3002G158000 [Sorghum bicolor]
MESYMDSLVIRNGWADLMDNECVSQGDIGLFTRTESMAFSLTIMTRGGLQKSPTPNPLTNTNKRRRVVQWAEVKFFHGKGVKRTPKLVSTLYSIWVSSRHPIVLFAAHMKQSAVENRTLLLARDVLAKLPAGPAKIGLVFDGSSLIYSGNIQKREDQSAKINGGWLDFVRANGIKIGFLYVFKFEICDGGWQVTVYEV